MKTINAFKTQLPLLKSLPPSARLLLLAMMMDGLSYGIWGLFFNFYFLEAGFDREFLGFITSTHSVAALVLGLPLGILSDRIGRKRSMIIGYATASVTSAIMVMVPVQGVILVMTFLSGAGMTLFFLSVAPFLMNLSTKENRSLVFSLEFGLVTLAGALSSLVAGYIPGRFAAWFDLPDPGVQVYRLALLAAILVGLLLFIPLSMVKEQKPQTQYENDIDPHTKPRLDIKPLWQTLTRPLTLKLVLPNLVIGLGAALLVPYLNLFFVDTFQTPDETLGTIFSLSALITAVGGLLSPWLAARLGTKIRAVVAAQASSLIFLLLMGFSPLFGMAAAGFLLPRGALMNMAVPLYNAFAMEQVAEREQGTVNSLKELGWQVGWVVGPAISGLVQVRYGFSPLFIITGLLYSLSIALTWAFFQRIETPNAPSPVPQQVEVEF